MSGKRQKKSNLWLAAAITAACLIAAGIFFLTRGEATPTPGTVPEEPESSDLSVENLETAGVALPEGLVINDIGSYTGLYMEDGSDEILSKILMLVVTNTAKKTVQYAEITLTDGAETAHFTLTTLPPGESAVLLEQNRMSYEDGKNLTQANAQNVAHFPQEPTLCEDKLDLQALDGMLNVTNVSGEDITGNIAVYYKNASSDMLYGGITYRVTISGGLKAGEIRQITASHFSAAGSRIMFATVS